MTKPLHLIILFSILSIALMGCSPIVRPEQLVNNESVPLGDGALIGQTFFARYRGLSGIEVYLKPNRAEIGELALTLFNNPQKQEVLAKSNLSMEVIAGPDYYLFAFPGIKNSTNRDYYFEISAQRENSLEIGAGPGQAYLDGALYQNNIPQDKQVAFRLAYEPYQLIMGLGSLGLSWLQILMVTAFLFILPGWAVLSFWESKWTLWSLGEKLGLSAAVSVAIYPIFFLWTDLVGLHLGLLYAWLPATLALGAIAWRNGGWWAKLREIWSLNKTRSWLYAITPADFTLIVLLGLIFATRFWVIRNLEVPLWGDSYQHAMIAQLLVDNLGLFDSWEPYAELNTFTYHFGFHSLTAVFHWATNIPIPKATLWMGQILNGLALISLYPLAVKISSNRWAGVFAVLLAGLISPMPMYYVNWGRYTQLAGQVILPGAALALWTAYEKGRKDLTIIALSSILVGGLALTHYRVLVFGGLFIIALLLFNIGTWKRNVAVHLLPVVLSTLGAMIIFLPWLIHVFRGQILQIFLSQVTTAPSNLSTFTQQYNAIGDLSSYLPPYLWILFLFALGAGFWRRERNFAIVALWWLLIMIAANPQWLNLPGAGAITNFAVFITAYLPVSVLVGAVAGWLVDVSPGKKNSVISGSFALVIFAIALGIWGSLQRINDINVAEHALVTRADLRAAEWIQNNTDTGAKFLVNSFFAYGGSAIVGSDGGWWLPLLSNRQTTLPPLTYTSEGGPRPDYREWINSLTAEFLDGDLDSREVLDKLSRRKVTHVYIGHQDGQVNYSGARLDGEQLSKSKSFKEIYHQDRVRIFEIID